jgi:ribosomal subunit interface protein
MTLRVSGKNIDIGESLRTYVGARIDLVVLKYSAEPTGGHVTIEREGSGFRTDCTLHLDSGLTLQAEAEAHDAYSSFNKAADRIERRLQRSKRRVKDRASGSLPARQAEARNPATAIERAADPETGGDANPIVIAESPNDLKEMSVSAAVEQLDARNALVVIFRRPGDGRTNIVYRRADGNIGWLDLQSPSKNATP